MCLLTPRELAAEIPPKMLVGRQDCLHKAWVGRQDRRLKCIGNPACLHKFPTFYVGNPAYLPTFLEAFPQQVREELIERDGGV